MERAASREPTDWFKRIIDIVTLLVLIGGFYFAYDQAQKINATLKEAQRNNDLAIWNPISQQWLALDKLFIDNPEVRPYLYGGKEVAADSPDFGKIYPFVIYVLDFIDYAGSSASGSKPEINFLSPEVWEIYFMQIFANSPMVCRELFRNAAIYSPKTRSMAGRACVDKSAAPQKSP